MTSHGGSSEECRHILMWHEQYGCWTRQSAGLHRRLAPMCRELHWTRSFSASSPQRRPVMTSFACGIRSSPGGGDGADSAVTAGRRHCVVTTHPPLAVDRRDAGCDGDCVDG